MSILSVEHEDEDGPQAGNTEGRIEAAPAAAIPNNSAANVAEMPLAASSGQNREEILLLEAAQIGAINEAPDAAPASRPLVSVLESELGRVVPEARLHANDNCGGPCLSKFTSARDAAAASAAFDKSPPRAAMERSPREACKTTSPKPGMRRGCGQKPRHGKDSWLSDRVQQRAPTMGEDLAEELRGASCMHDDPSHAQQCTNCQRGRAVQASSSQPIDAGSRASRLSSPACKPPWSLRTSPKACTNSSLSLDLASLRRGPPLIGAAETMSYTETFPHLAVHTQAQTVRSGTKSQTARSVSKRGPHSMLATPGVHSLSLLREWRPLSDGYDGGDEKLVEEIAHFACTRLGPAHLNLLRDRLTLSLEQRVKTEREAAATATAAAEAAAKWWLVQISAGDDADGGNRSCRGDGPAARSRMDREERSRSKDGVANGSGGDGSRGGSFKAGGVAERGDAEARGAGGGSTVHSRREGTDGDGGRPYGGSVGGGRASGRVGGGVGGGERQRHSPREQPQAGTDFSASPPRDSRAPTPASLAPGAAMCDADGGSCASRLNDAMSTWPRQVRENFLAELVKSKRGDADGRISAADHARSNAFSPPPHREECHSSCASPSRRQIASSQAPAVISSRTSPRASKLALTSPRGRTLQYRSVPSRHGNFGILPCGSVMLSSRPTTTPATTGTSSAAASTTTSAAPAALHSAPSASALDGLSSFASLFPSSPSGTPGIGLPLPAVSNMLARADRDGKLNASAHALVVPMPPVASRSYIQASGIATAAVP